MSDVDPHLPDSMERRVAELERRLRVMESTNRLTSASIKEGALDIRNEDDEVMVRLGELAEDGGKFGVFVYSPDLNQYMFYADDDGMALPFYSSPFRPANGLDTNGAVKVTSTSFTTTHTTAIELVVHDAVRVRVACSATGLETGEVRIRNRSTGDVTDPQEFTAAAPTLDFRWLHDAALGSGPYYFDVQIRQKVGVGGVWAWAPDSGAVFYRGSFMTPAATANGL